MSNDEQMNVECRSESPDWIYFDIGHWTFDIRYLFNSEFERYTGLRNTHYLFGLFDGIVCFDAIFAQLGFNGRLCCFLLVAAKDELQQVIWFGVFFQPVFADLSQAGGAGNGIIQSTQFIHQAQLNGPVTAPNTSLPYAVDELNIFFSSLGHALLEVLVGAVYTVL